MLKKSNIRDKYIVTTHDSSGQKHYVLKSMIMHRVKTRFSAPAESLCKLIRVGRAAKVLLITPHSTVTCQGCLRALAKLEEIQAADQKLEEVKMLKTSDGKIFPLTARKKALAHEDELCVKQKGKNFIASVKTTLFTDMGGLDEDLVREFEGAVSDAIENNIEDMLNVSASLAGFLGMLHEILVGHGAKIRSMLILYQKIYGTLVPCRTTMINMKKAGMDTDIYL